MVTAPGRLPICFRCEGVGHMRHECLNSVAAKSAGRSYATAVQTPAVSKPGQGTCGKSPVQGQGEAVGKPPSGQTTEEAVSKPP